MKKIFNNLGQNIMEYVLILVVIFSSVVAFGFLTKSRNTLTNYVSKGSTSIASFK